MFKHLAIFTTLTLAFNANAQLLEWNAAGYEYNGTAPTNVPPDAATYATVAAGASATGFFLNNGADQTGSITNGFSARSTTATATINLASLSSLRYASFTLTPDVGNILDLTSLTYGVSRLGTTAAHPTRALWGYRVDSGSGFGGWTVQNDGDGFLLGNSHVSNSADQSTWDFADFSTSGTVEFGIWAWGGNNAAAGIRIFSLVDSGFAPGMIVNGNVAPVPEPTTYGFLIGVGLIALAAIRFQRKRKVVQP